MNKVLEDSNGNKSSKRVVALSSAITFLILSSFVVIYGCFRVIPNTTLIATVLGSLTTTSLVSLGLSVPEMFAKRNKG